MRRQVVKFDRRLLTITFALFIGGIIAVLGWLVGFHV